MTTYASVHAEIQEIRARQNKITSKTRPSEAEMSELLRLEGQVEALENQAAELHEAEVFAVRNGGTASILVAGGEDHTSFLNYMRTGERPQNASISSTDGNGGYLIPNSLLAALTEKVRKSDPILRLATTFDMRGGNSTLELPVKATHGVVTTATETGARTEQNAPTFTSASLTAVDYYTDQRATQLWMDSTPNSEEMMLRFIVEDIYEQLGVDLSVGDGSGNAAGLFAGTSYYATKLSGVADSIANTSFPTLYAALAPKFRVNASWLMNSATFATVLGYVYPNTQTPLVQWVNGTPTILGRPVYECTSAPAVGNGAFPIAFGDIAAGYAIGEHFGPAVLVDPFTVPPYKRFYGVGRLGGCPWNPDAIVLLKSDDA